MTLAEQWSGRRARNARHCMCVRVWWWQWGDKIFVCMDEWVFCVSLFMWRWPYAICLCMSGWVFIVCKLCAFIHVRITLLISLLCSSLMYLVLLIVNMCLKQWYMGIGIAYHVSFVVHHPNFSPTVSCFLYFSSLSANKGKNAPKIIFKKCSNDSISIEFVSVYIVLCFLFIFS